MKPNTWHDSIANIIWCGEKKKIERLMQCQKRYSDLCNVKTSEVLRKGIPFDQQVEEIAPAHVLKDLLCMHEIERKTPAWSTMDALGRGGPCLGSYSAISRSTLRLLVSLRVMRTSRHHARRERGPLDPSLTCPSCATGYTYTAIKVMDDLARRTRTCFIANNLPVARSLTRETTPNAPDTRRLGCLQMNEKTQKHTHRGRWSLISQRH
jgi:hypothetical protein